ncbi:hypothetical protein, partial [Clostridium perfringens]|uniref:hypothetical protein n=1 Tax=Clostridium perfringens TaxID=1502 RepID=UPI002ACC2864
DQVKSVTLLTDVETAGEKTVGLAVEYPFEIDNTSLPTKNFDKAFEVNVVNANGVKENRKITNVYVNNEPKTTKEAKSGNYVIIELDKTESAANTLVFDMSSFLNSRQITNYSFKQLANIKAKNGDVI